MKLLLLFTLFTNYLFAAPAYDGFREFKQADGTTFMAKGQGNQHLNWLEAEDGSILKRNQKSKNFDYAEIKNNKLKASGEKFEKQNSKKAKALSTQPSNKISKESVNNLWKIKREDAQRRRHIEY